MKSRTKLIGHERQLKAGVRLVMALVVAGLTALAARAANDLGPANEMDAHTVGVCLKPRDLDKLEVFVKATVTPGDPQFRKFLTPEQATARYCPTEAEVAQMRARLAAAGLEVTEVAANRLAVKASGTVGAINRYFNTVLHRYEEGGVTYIAPATAPTIPAELANATVGFSGLSTKPLVKHRVSARPDAGTTSKPALKAAVSPGSPPGFLTVTDVARMYQVNPFYNRGYRGEGQTVGIATFAGYDPADIYDYWAGIGLSVKPARITRIPVNGGAFPWDGPGSDGSLETALDIEQAGGLAPWADIMVYEAPNTDFGFFWMFVQVLIDNRVDTLSISWGLSEPDGVLSGSSGLMDVLSILFQIGAAQGISYFAASGDAGAYDFNRFLPYGFYNDVFSVNFPASSPYMTAVGGLTLPGLIDGYFWGTTTPVNIPETRAWAWDYIAPYFSPYDYLNYLFPVGGGGGVSFCFGKPWYQRNTPGIQLTANQQSCRYFPDFPSLSSSFSFLDLPGNFAGRNVPDVSLNSDPFTGFLVAWTPAWWDPSWGRLWWWGYGGTSFAAPQLNGITSLIAQTAGITSPGSSGKRLGFLNPQLYRILRTQGYYATRPCFNDITAGNNLGYPATPGYDPATGIGSINAWNLGLQLR
jgi:subtilase family serine protease